MLSLLTGAAMSAAELARELHITQANASYHLRKLSAAGEVVEAGDERIRGGVAKRYRYQWDDPPDYKGSSEQEQRLYVQAMAHQLVQRHLARKAATRRNLTDAELWVEPEVWQQVLGQVEAASLALHRAARPVRSEGTIRVNMTAALFRMTDAPHAGRERDENDA